MESRSRVFFDLMSGFEFSTDYRQPAETVSGYCPRSTGVLYEKDDLLVFASLSSHCWVASLGIPPGLRGRPSRLASRGRQHALADEFDGFLLDYVGSL